MLQLVACCWEERLLGHCRCKEEACTKEPSAIQGAGNPGHRKDSLLSFRLLANPPFPISFYFYLLRTPGDELFADRDFFILLALTHGVHGLFRRTAGTTVRMIAVRTWSPPNTNEIQFTPLTLEQLIMSAIRQQLPEQPSSHFF